MKSESILRGFFLLVVVVLSEVIDGSNYYDINDAVLFKTVFEAPETPIPGTIHKDKEESIIIMSKDQEKYRCSIPSLGKKSGDGKDEEGENGRKEEKYGNPMKILEKLFVSSTCAYRLEHYWTYELCHGKYIRQFHDERSTDTGKDGKISVKTTEYILGRYSKEDFDKQVEYFEGLSVAAKVNENDRKKPPKMKIENMNMPYLDIYMTDGTQCDLNGKPRSTRVIYVCYPQGKNEIFSLKESSTCEYEVIILSSVLCQNHDYRPDESTEEVIRCQPVLNEEDGTIPDVKPKSLIEFERKTEELRSQEIMSTTAHKGDFIQIIPSSEEDDDDLEPIRGEKHKEQNWPKSSEREEIKPLMNDPEVVQQFLLGEHCLYGGAGWWKYQFCYGKRVIQYHEEKYGQRTEIMLGEFDHENHLKWLEQFPAKRPKKDVESRKHISHFYSNGDVCDLTGKPRQVEVKLKCKASETTSSVSIYLLEPKTCDYVLGIESPIVCDILRLADSDGMIQPTKTNFQHNQQEQQMHKSDISNKP